MKADDGSPPEGRIWIQGAGDLASGIACRLARCRYGIVMAEVAQPRVVRRLVAFAEAVREGRVEIEGVSGSRQEAQTAAFTVGRVTVIVDPEARQMPRLRPDAVIDARMSKKQPAALPRAGAPLIGLGPGFRCGRDATFIIETHRGARLGAVLDHGEAAADTGIPGTVAGESDRRVLRSPAAGRLVSPLRIGNLVQAGQIVGHVAEVPVVSQLTGLLRGLIHPAVELSVGDKVGDIDPRGSAIDPCLVSDKALAVAGGVLEALLRLRIKPA